MDRADRLIGLSDGGAGLEARPREIFPRVEHLVLDFFLPAEKLTAIARLHAKDQGRAEVQVRRWRGLFKDEESAVLAAELSEWEWPRRPALREEARALVGYLERNARRIECPEYLAKGRGLGSGAVESACKTVVRQLLRSTTGKVSLIGDRLRAHMTSAVQGWVAAHRERIEVFYLPRYSPELNPDEYLNNDLKGQVNEAGLPPDTKEVRSRIQGLMRRLLHLPEHVMHYFRHPSARYASAIN